VKQKSAPVLTVTSRAMTRNISVDTTSPRRTRAVPRAQLQHFLRPTKLIPTTGIVKQRADEITAGSKTDADKSRAIYEWIVANTRRNPQTLGCAPGTSGSCSNPTISPESAPT